MDEPRLYILDDDPLVGELVSLVGQAAGFTSRLVGDANTLAELLRQDPQGCLVLDIVMPDIDGLEVLKILGREGFKGPILILSGMDALYLEAASRSARRLGLAYAGSITKPIDLPTLGEAIRRMKDLLPNA